MLRNKKHTPEKSVLAIVLGLLFFYFKTAEILLLYIVITLVLIGVFSTTLTKYVDLVWMKLAELLGKVIPTILLTIIFYGFLFPIAILSRLFGAKNGIQLKNNQQSFFKEVNKKYTKESFLNPW